MKPSMPCRSAQRMAVAAAALLIFSLQATDVAAADDRARRHAPGGSEGATLSKPAPAASATASAAGSPSHVIVEAGVERPLWIDNSRVVEFPQPGQPGQPAIRAAEPGEVGEGGRTGKVAGTAALPAGNSSPVSPVFVDASGQPRALPGGVIVALKRELPGEEAIERLQSAGLVPVRQIGERMWLVEAPAGVASLDLANRLAGSGQFEFVQPNWWQPRTTK